MNVGAKTPPECNLVFWSVKSDLDGSYCGDQSRVVNLSQDDSARKASFYSGIDNNECNDQAMMASPYYSLHDL